MCNNTCEIEFLDNLFTNFPIIAFIKDTNYRYTRVNKRFLNYYDVTEQDVLGKTDVELNFIKDLENFEKFEHMIVEKGIEITDMEGITLRQGKKRIIKYRKVPLYKNGQIIGILGVFDDVDDLRQVEQQLSYNSTHDKLTGLFNRSFLMAELNRLDARRNYPLSVVIIDIDGLKLFNDTFGHAFGDVLLIRVAETLSKCLREDDVISRLGGDEFSILLPNTDKYKAQEIMECVNCEISCQTLFNIPISISYGITTQYSSKRSISEIMTIADSNMYIQKETERTKYKQIAINAIIDSLFSKSPMLREHSILVSNFAPLIGTEIELDERSCKDLGIMGYYHDIGLVSVSSEIFNKPIELTNDEYILIKKHASKAFAILSSSPLHSSYALAISSHHERYDGKGYPEGLYAENIPIYSRVLNIADAISAMCCDRPYRKALTLEQIKMELVDNSGTQFDPSIVSVTLPILPELLKIKQSGEYIRYVKDNIWHC